MLLSFKSTFAGTYSGIACCFIDVPLLRSLMGSAELNYKYAAPTAFRLTNPQGIVGIVASNHFPYATPNHFLISTSTTLEAMLPL
jgi:hypothetical protein